MKRWLRKYRRQKVPKSQVDPDEVVFKYREDHKEQAVTQRAGLEDVPVEIQQAILHHMPDMHTLQALISTSPCYLRSYQSQRHAIMSSILVRDIHPDVLFDALAIVDAQKLPRNYEDYVPKLKVFVAQYMATRNSPVVAHKSLDPGTRDILWKFHQSVLDVTKDFCDHAMLVHPITGAISNHHRPLSPNEVRRIHRAFYRYELFTVLFREPKLSRRDESLRRRDHERRAARPALQRDSIRSLDSNDMSWLFLTYFNAWEVEEIGCIRDYLTYRYGELYKVLALDFRERTGREYHFGDDSWAGSSNFDGIVESARIRHELEADMRAVDEEDRYRYHLFLGLDFFRNLILASHDDQMRILLESALNWTWESLTTALKEERLWGTDPLYESFEDGAYYGPCSDSDKDAPNAAWTWSTGNKVELNYFQPDKEELRGWGYVMWDKERLGQWGILEEDPREYCIVRERRQIENVEGREHS